MISVSLRSNDPSVTRHKPGLECLLKAVGLDVVYERAEGDLLYYRDSHADEVEVLDLVGGYGVLLLGHHHPEIVAAVTTFLASGHANHVQGSIRRGAAQLANVLNLRVGGDHCTILANSGTEAVEAALKHAMLETQAHTFIALDGGFHGKTMGALHITSNPRFRKPFGSGHGNVIRVPPGDVRQLKATFDRARDLAGFIYEPIQGEAGVRPLTAEFVQAAADLCADRNIPLIADECQSGLGRTGTFLASETFGVTPDYVILSKGLGGGLAKISALLIDRKRYRPDFDLLHTSTFADDELSCHAALKVLDLVDADAMEKCRSKGSYLLEQMRSLQRLYPGVIADVRGRGLMIGVELQSPDRQAGFILNHLADRQLLGPLVASYLLKKHQIRVASTLSDSWTIRLQPSLLIGRERLDQFVTAMKDVCARLAGHDVVGLTRFLAEEPAEIGPVPSQAPTETPIYFYRRNESSLRPRPDGTTSAPTRRVAWVFHLIDSSDLAHMDPALGTLTAEEKTAFCDRWSSLCEPVVMDAIDIQSSTSEVVRLYPLLLPVTSQWMLNHSRGKDRFNARRLVQKAVDVAAGLGCSVVSLGQFTSIATRRGQSLNSRNMRITAGSNYTAALVSQAVRAELDQRSWDPMELTLGIVGAAGDVASTCAAMMASEFRQCILVGSGRVGSLDRLNKVATGIPGARVATSLQAIEDADVVVCATNSTTTPLGPECLHSQAIVCDASVPATLQKRISDVLPMVTIFPGAIVELPHKEQLDIPGFPLPPGFTYGCMAEGLLLGLDGQGTRPWSGRSCSRRALEISQVAARHGFRVAEHSSLLNSSDSLL